MYHSIMVPLDGSSFSEYALPYALSIARQSLATLHLTYVRVPATPVSKEARFAEKPIHDQEHTHVQSYLQQLGQVLSERWEVPIIVTVLEGVPADALRKRAQDLGVDLIVMATHARGPLPRLWLGSVANALVRMAPAPLLLVRPREEPCDLLESLRERIFQRILIPLDGSLMAERALEPAMTLGALMGAEYTLLQAVAPPMLGYAPATRAAQLDEWMLRQWQDEVTGYLEQIAAPMRARGLTVTTTAPLGHPAAAIQEHAHAHAIDLIAMATHGRGGIGRVILGSVADEVVREAGVPVLLCRPREEGEGVKG
jgi:nucleotide-binding universal stress UspA family protein